MPVYVFSCCKCWDSFEVMRPVEDRNGAQDCPRCGTRAVREFTPCAIKQPCKDWAKKTARDLLGRDQKSSRVIVTKGMAKPIVR